MDVQQQHFNQVAHDIGEELIEMTSRYDSKTLAIILLVHAAGMIRVSTACGFFTPEEAKRTVDGALEDIFKPVAEKDMPKVQMIGAPSKLS